MCFVKPALHWGSSPPLILFACLFVFLQEGLDLVEESEQYTHLLTLEENYDPEDLLSESDESSIY